MTAFQPFDFHDTTCEVMDLYKETILNGIRTYKKEATIYRKRNGGKELILINVRVDENAKSFHEYILRLLCFLPVYYALSQGISDAIIT